MTSVTSNTRRYAAMAGSLALPVLLAACSSLDRHAVVMEARRHSQVSGYRIAQLGHGEGSYYGFCLTPACPGVTAKTPADQDKPIAQMRQNDNTKIPMPALAAPSTLVVHFPTGSAVLDTHDAQRISQWSVRAGRLGTIAIAGRTDDVGAEALNHRLAGARARAVADYLRDQLGVAPARLSWEARGVCCYVGDNTTDSGRQANRRAEITFHSLTEGQP
ncbi:hypothetical protein GCM10027277_25380 [Pseudoduganella ginsengisoli]|uniref:OmpA family protein n=1 Tax=Pseudoduganella ginsengisoli TaxID=1462440 RepID=A0A6L6Q0H4_9BURK|nr:OmpA family protein [Pseudoduganella ginsengisoli]MTW02738.1 OmpA family protein [Pseudoduganella ginsengisoli]